ncbi:PilN domain-containing protein [Magnetospirillum sp. UT-4]|uniref:PilN domain-containing protein n=1 Tax=Magnetospirillum sp. UT-4 TaxID=2681467 RepID=UPI00138451C6|nr:PilN domain-containing protein [Magnetospirillum sp. UT-4]CAA7621443.1 hypothetical protein MTBUT4_390017 [Magnetospirillum sp. UT-4]
MRADLRRFLAWWQGELAALVPPGLARLGRTRPLLPRDSALVRRLTLPLAAEQDLRRVLEFEMDRLTPFTADQLCFDALVERRDPARGHLVVLLAAAPRARAEAAAGRGRLGVEGLPAAIDLMRGRRRRPGIALAVVAALAVAALVLPFQRQAGRQAAAEQQLETARAAAAAAERQRRQVDGLLAAERLAVGRGGRPTALETVEALSVLLPDDCWLHSLTLTAEGLEFAATAAAAGQVLRLVEDSPLFEAAVFRAPVSSDPGVGDRFALAARWQGEKP